MTFKRQNLIVLKNSIGFSFILFFLFFLFTGSIRAEVSSRPETSSKPKAPSQPETSSKPKASSQPETSSKPKAPSQTSSSQETFYSYVGQFQASSSGLARPTSIAIDSTGRVFVACSLTDEIRVFDSSGRFLFTFGSKPSLKDKNKTVLSEPSGLAIDKQGQIYVSDLAVDKVLIYDSDGVFKSQFPLYRPEKGRDVCAPFIAYNPLNNRLYIPDACNHLIGIYTLDGKFETSFGSSGSGEGAFSGPAHLCFDSKGNSYVVDAGNFRVQSFTPDFKFRFAIGKTGTQEGGDFIRPYDVAIDTKGRIYVSDFILNSVQVFNQNMEYLGSLSQPDNPRTFSQPLGLAHLNNKIYVVNAETRVVSMFDVSR